MNQITARPISPSGRPGMPDDIAIAVYFAVTDLAGFVTGLVTTAEGGHHLG